MGTLRLALVASLALAASAHAEDRPLRLYRITLVRVDVGPPPGRAVWDPPKPRRPGPKKSCCEGVAVDDAPTPDLQVIVSSGARRFASRVHYDQTEAALGEFAYLTVAPTDNALDIEVVDVDGEEQESIGKTRLVLPPGGFSSPLRFGAVRSLELTIVPVPRAEESFVVDKAELDTPLFVYGEETVRVAAEGEMCVGKRCTGPGAALRGFESRAPGIALGRLQVSVGDGAPPSDFSDGLRYRARAGGYLSLALATTPHLPLAGKYRVTVDVEP